MNWIEDRIQQWHKNQKDAGPLAGFLGMSEALYTQLVEQRFRWVLGMDEVGYGAYAGPLVIGGVLAPIDWTHPKLKDSKKFKDESARGQVLLALPSVPGASYFLVRSSSEVIDKHGVYRTRMGAFRDLAAAVCAGRDDVLVVIDGEDRVPDLDHVALAKADGFVPQCMAASIVAKVYRDTEMMQLARLYPPYGFDQNKGYGTPFHEDALDRHGPCPIHRKSYRPIQRFFLSSTSAQSTG